MTPVSSPEQARAAPIVQVIDDRAENVSLIGQLLSQAGFDVVPASSAEEGLALAAKVVPDLVLLDMDLPQEAGFDVLRGLQAQAQTRPVPVIFLTADVDHDSVARAFGAGAIDYIAKPFVPEELLMRVQTQIELKRSRDALWQVVSLQQKTAETVVHDLRNYFASILFAADMLRDLRLDNVTRARLIDSICTSGDSGVTFLQSFLEQQVASAERAMLEHVATAALHTLVVQRGQSVRAMALPVESGKG